MNVPLQHPPSHQPWDGEGPPSALPHWLDDKADTVLRIALWGTRTSRGSCASSSTRRTYFQKMGLLRISLTLWLQSVSKLLCSIYTFCGEWLSGLNNAELCLALLPDFLKWEIEEKVTLMTFLLPEASIKWYESNLHSNCNTSPSESLCPGGGEEHGSHINNEIQTHLLLNHRKVNSGYTITVGGGLIYWSLGQIILFSAAEATGNKSRGQGLCWQGP